MAAVGDIRTGDIAVVAQGWLETIPRCRCSGKIDWHGFSQDENLKSRSGGNEYCQNGTRAIIIPD